MEKYTKRTAEYLNSFLGGEGYRLIKTEFVEENHNWYLRAYIDLTEEEYQKRLRKAEEARAAAEAGAEQKPEDGAAANGAKVEEAEAEGAKPGEMEPADGIQHGAEEETELPGVSINDCVKVSRRLGKWLDQEDFISEMYTLEVCSQGFLKDHETSE